MRKATQARCVLHIAVAALLTPRTLVPHTTAAIRTRRKVHVPFSCNPIFRNLVCEVIRFLFISIPVFDFQSAVKLVLTGNCVKLFLLVVGNFVTVLFLNFLAVLLRFRVCSKLEEV